MGDERGAGRLHTLDTVERPFYIPRTHAQQHSPRPLAGNRSQRRSPAISNGAFPRVRARFSRGFPVSPFSREVPAKPDFCIRQGSPRSDPPRFRPSRAAGGRPGGAGRVFAFVPQTSEPNLGGPPWAAGTQEDEE
jgi:hypothetical protein